MDNVTDPGSADDELVLRGRGSDDRPTVRFPVWMKMVAAVVVPLGVVALLAMLQVLQARDKVRQVDEETTLAAVALAPGGLFDALIIERGDAAVSVVGARDGTGIHTESFAESISDSDAAAQRLREAVEDGGPRVEEAYRDAFVALDDLAELRSTTEEYSENANFGNMGLAHELYVGYSAILGELSDAGGQLGAEITDPELRASAGVLDSVNELHDKVSDITYNVSIAVAVQGLDDLSARDHVVRVAEDYRSSLDRLRTIPGEPWSEEVSAFADSEPYSQVLSMSETALAGGEFDMAAFLDLLPRVDDRANPPLGSSQAVANAGNDALQARIDQLRSDAAAEQQRYLILAIAVVLGATLVAALVARSITRPMMSLARQAYEMASQGLPAAVQQVLETPPGADPVAPVVAPVEVPSRDETQVVAAALNEVQLSAVDLAVQQATLRQQTSDSLVNLGRRTQNLIGLQLELITDLEQEEADPAALAHLYRLDHLATRARRNAESLVVLAGTEAPPNDGRPTSLFDVVRAALSEVEDYQRVQVLQLDEAHVTGGLAVDLVHLLAELVENGVLFSPPTHSVEVTGALDDEGYTITVVDHGIGMTAAQLDEANQRLSETRTFTAAPSRHLGHHVAGRLASRVGARVWVAPGVSGGTVARVHIPTGRLTSGPAAPDTDSNVSRPAEGGASSPSASAAADRGSSPRPQSTRAPAFDDLELGDYRVDGRPPVAPVEPETTSSGLTRRVKGANGPGVHTAIQPIRPDAPRSAETGTAPPRPVPGRRAEEVASMLSSFTGAVQKGRDDAEQARARHNGGAVPATTDPIDPDRSADPEAGPPVDRVAEEERT